MAHWSNDSEKPFADQMWAESHLPWTLKKRWSVRTKIGLWIGLGLGLIVWISYLGR